MSCVAVKDGKGPLENLYITETSIPKPGDDEVLIKVHAFGINRMDLLQRQGLYPVPPQAKDLPMGVEFSGTIVSSNSTAFKKDDEVFGLSYGGAYAEYLVNSARLCIPLTHLSHTQAAGIPEVWFTAIQALYTVGDLKPKETVLIHAGASGVGLAAIQLARNAGCTVYSTAGSDAKTALCESMGSDKSINYKTSDFAELGECVDLIIDFVGANYWAKNISVAKRDCRIVYLATLSGGKVEIDIMQILYKRLRIQGTTLRSRDLDYQSDLRAQFETLAWPYLKSGVFKAHIDKVYNWKDIVSAQGRMERNEGDGGKIICEL